MKKRYYIFLLVLFSIKQVDAQIITTIVGGGSCGSTYCGDGGQATDAELNDPTGLKIDAYGNMFVADVSNQCIRKISTTSIISTYAGGNSQGLVMADLQRQRSYMAPLVYLQMFQVIYI